MTRMELLGVLLAIYTVLYFVCVCTTPMEEMKKPSHNTKILMKIFYPLVIIFGLLTLWIDAILRLAGIDLIKDRWWKT